MKYLLIALTLLTANAAKADVITCFQTEPFIADVIDTEARTMKQTNAGEPMASYKDIKIVIKAKGVIEIRSRKGQVLRSIDLNQEGSDGMSERVYPFACTDQRGVWAGGGESSELKANDAR